MTIGTLKTQGTELYLINPLGSAPAVLKFACPTGINGLGGAADQLEDTCLDATVDRTFKRGLGNPGTVSVPFNFIPSDDSHQVLFLLQADGRNLSWLVALSDGTGAPTLDSDDDFAPPAGRTCAQFEGYVADVTIDIATNEIVRGTLLIQRSGVVTFSYAGS
jgi:hypothetical protein